MDKSLSNFEMTESTLKASTDGSDPDSDKSEPIELLGFIETDQSSNTNNGEIDFDHNLPETVTLLKHNAMNAKCYLIGTAHFSRESQEDVRKVIRTVCPDTVLLELCPGRIHILSLDERTILAEASTIDMRKIYETIRSNGIYSGLMYLLLLNMSAQLTRQLGMAPGGEFRVAYEETAKIPNCTLRLGDRPIDITIKRALACLSWLQSIKLIWNLITTNDTISLEDIENCKKRDILEQLIGELAGDYPEFRQVLLEERDIFLTYSLQEAIRDCYKHDKTQPIKVVGVVGIGHVLGITKLWPIDQSEAVPDTLHIPPPTMTTQIVRLTFRLTAISLGGFLLYRYVGVPRLVRNSFNNFLTNIRL